MSDSNDEDSIGLDPVEEAVGKAGHESAPKARTERMPALREGGQPLVGEFYRRDEVEA